MLDHAQNDLPESDDVAGTYGEYPMPREANMTSAKKPSYKVRYRELLKKYHDLKAEYKALTKSDWELE